MRYDKRVTSKQITFAAAAIIITTSLLTKQLYIVLENEAWIAVITGLTLTLLMILIYTSLAGRFQGLSIIQINDAVYGPFFGKVISVLYIYFFFTIACLNTNLAGGFIKEFILTNTPTIFVLVLFMMISVWAVRKGPIDLLSYSVLITLISIVFILLNTLLLFKEIDIKNLMPVFSHNMTDYLIGTHSVAMIPLCDPFVLMMFLPNLQKPQGFGSALSKGVIIGALFLLVIVVRDAAVLGQASAVYNYPTLISIRQIDVGDILTRMDILYISMLVILMFYKVSIFFYAAVTGFQHLFKFQSYKFLVNIAGAFILFYAMIIVQSSQEHLKWLADGAVMVHHTFFVVLLPLITIVVATVRGFYKQPKTA